MGGEVSLGSLLARVETGWSPACDAYPPAGDEWGIIKVSAVTSGDFDPGEAKRLPADLQPRQRLEIQPGDVLVARANGARSLVGAVCQVGPTRRRLMLSDKILRLVPDKDLAESAFLGILLRSMGVRQQIGNLLNGGTGQNNISQADVRTLRVPSIPLDEQRGIVDAHAVFERRIGVLKGVLDKLRAARTGLLDALVVGPRVALGKVLADRPKNGYSPSEVPEWTGLQALGLGCLTTQGFVPKQLKRVPNSPLGQRYLLQDGDLLMSRANTRELVGQAGRYRDVGYPCIYPDLMMRLHPDEAQCLTSYLELVLQSGPVRAAVQGAARGTSESMVKISAAIVEELRVPLPDVERQHEIVEAVASMDRRIQRQAAVVDKLRTVQQAVVEDLLTGRSKAYAA
jgi:type I restriction enzyme S subunit